MSNNESQQPTRNNEQEEVVEDDGDSEWEDLSDDGLLETVLSAMNANATNSQQHDNTENENEEDDSEEEAPLTTVASDEIAKMLGCAHYKQNCLLKAVCCNKYYSCRFCHNEANPMHEMDRFAVREVKCIKCDTEQPISNQCIKCQTEFGKYYCATCKLFENHPTKSIYHCDGCGICRIGPQSNYFHCDVCCLCLPTSLKGNHKCVEKTAHQDCPICREFLFTSTDNAQLMPCGHSIHSKCYKEMIKNGILTCPICNKTVVDLAKHYKHLDEEIAQTPMPQEYQNLKVKILCKDCQAKSEVNWHIFGLKCSACGSYNTAKN